MRTRYALDTYYRIRTQYRRRPPKERPKTDEPEMGSYLTWCDHHAVDPLKWMEDRFKIIFRGSRGKTVPRISQLRSDKFLSLWKRHDEADHDKARQYVRLKDDASKASESIRHLVPKEPLPNEERLKHIYRSKDQADLCALKVKDTGGYHPRSKFCLSCPMTAKCALSLYQTHGFDVAQARVGNLAVLPAHVASSLNR